MGEREATRPAGLGTCPAQTGPVWKFGGEPCGCTLPEGHPADVDHECSCGSWWVDSIRRDERRP